MKHTETIENILHEMQKFHVYEDMPPAKQLAIAGDVQHEIEEYDIFLHEYLAFRFDTLTQEQRRKYLPISEYAWRMPKNVNKEMFSGKYDFYNKAKRFISREYICLEDASGEDFKKFLERHEKILVKPLYQQGGSGISVYHTANWTPDALYDKLMADNTPLAEELIIQHPDMAKFHPSSLNTIRVLTFTDFNGNITVNMASIRTGIGLSVCDNVCRGGLIAPIDIHTGTVMADANDNTCHRYERHPETGVAFKGFLVPCFDKLMQKLCEYVRFFNDIHIVGWDIAIKENGDIELIEANTVPDMTDEQLHRPLAEIYRQLYVEGNHP